jgi:hypothetical protein
MRRTSRLGNAVYLGLCAALAAGVAACSGDSNQVASVSFDPLPSPPSVATADTASTAAGAATVAPTTALATTAPATTAPSTTAPPATPPPAPSTSDAGLTGPTFSDALGVKVDTAPGVHTRGDTRRLLAEGVYVHIAWEPDPNDASVFTVQPDDIAILEAYAMAQATYYRAAMGQIPTDHPDFDRYIVGGGQRFVKAFRKRADAGLTLSVGTGVVLRPYVLGDQRTDDSAIVLDCYLEDEHEIPKGDPPVFEPMEPFNLVVSMVRVDGHWKVDGSGDQAGVCL